MAKISISRTESGITLEANYFPPGVLATLAGGALIAPAVLGIEIQLGLTRFMKMGGLIDLLLPYALTAIGALFIFGGLMALGTAQVLTYNRDDKLLTYESTIAFFWGSVNCHPTEGLETINYNLHKIHHKANAYSRSDCRTRNNILTGSLSLDDQRTLTSATMVETHTSWNSSISLWYKTNNHGELAKISHSESLEEGIKMIAEELGVNFERHVNEESRGIG